MASHLKRRFFLGGLAALALGYAAWANRRIFLINDVTTGETPLYPELHSRVYYADPAHILASTERAIRSLPRWRVVHIDMANDALDAEVDTPIGGYTDDVTVYVTALSGGQSRVKIRSHSRVGKGDLGQNAVHIRELQAVVDARLTTDAAF